MNTWEKCGPGRRRSRCKDPVTEQALQGMAGRPGWLERNEGRVDEQEGKQEVGKERPVPAGLKAETWAFLLGEK